MVSSEWQKQSEAMCHIDSLCATLIFSWHGDAGVASIPVSNEVQLGAQGRLVIPAALRKALNLEPGDRLIARQEGDTLVLERREALENRLKDRFRHVPVSVSLVDELIAERRVDAANEALP